MVCIGLQGSRGRGEAGPDSDIDVVCILDACSLDDLEAYRAAVAEAYKSAVFLLQARTYLEQGVYCRRRADLAKSLTGPDLDILQTAQSLKAGETREDLTALTDRLLTWSGEVLRTYA